MTAHKGTVATRRGTILVLVGIAICMVGAVIPVWGQTIILIGILLAVAGMAVVVVVATRLSNAASAKRAAAQSYAASAGIAFQDKVPGLADNFRVLDGSTDWNVDAYSVIQGSEFGRDVVSLDRRGSIEDVVERTSGSYSRRMTFGGGAGQLVNAAALGGVVPALILRKRDGLDEEGLQLGGSTVLVESHEFNDRWWVRTDDKRLAHSVLTPALIERLLASDAQGIDLCFEGAWVFSTQSAVTKAPEYARHRRVVADVANLVPDFVLDGKY